MGDGNLLSLRWNNHISNFKYNLEQLQQKSIFSDAMIACDGCFYPVHKFVLATCSDYFGSIFEKMPCKHPVIILKDVAPKEVEFLLSYMYGGEVKVSQADLPSLIRAAETLHIRGLAAPDDPPGSPRQKFKTSQIKALNRENNESPAKKPCLDYLVSPINEIGVIKRETEEHFPSGTEMEQPQEEINQIQDTSLPLLQFDDNERLLPNENCFYKKNDKFSTPVRVKEESEENLTSDSSDSHDDDIQIQSLVTNVNEKRMPSVSLDNISVNDDTLSSSLQEHPSNPSYVSQQFQAVGDENVDSTAQNNRINFQNVHANISSIPTQNQIIFNCRMCDYMTHNKSWLNIHMRKHTGEKPYSCSYCPFRSAQKGNLNVHVRKIHSSLPVHPYSMVFNWPLNSTSGEERE